MKGWLSVYPEAAAGDGDFLLMNSYLREGILPPIGCPSQSQSGVGLPVANRLRHGSPLPQHSEVW